MKNRRHGQSTVEYAVMFTMVVAIIAWASFNVTRPSMNRIFRGTGNIFNASTMRLQNKAAQILEWQRTTTTATEEEPTITPPPEPEPETPPGPTEYSRL